MSGQYILDESGENAIPCDDILGWGLFMKDSKRIVKQETIGDYWISTVFLGLDYNFGSEGGPVLWETMAFPVEKVKERNLQEDFMDRCGGSRTNALAMHQEMVEKITNYYGDK